MASGSTRNHQLGENPSAESTNSSSRGVVAADDVTADQHLRPQEVRVVIAPLVRREERGQDGYQVARPIREAGQWQHPVAQETDPLPLSDGEAGVQEFRDRPADLLVGQPVPGQTDSGMGQQLAQARRAQGVWRHHAQRLRDQASGRRKGGVWIGWSARHRVRMPTVGALGQIGARQGGPACRYRCTPGAAACGAPPPARPRSRHVRRRARPELRLEDGLRELDEIAEHRTRFPRVDDLLDVERFRGAER